MNDLISRQDAIDEIGYEIEMINLALDSITLEFNARERLYQRRGEARDILNSIQVLPSAQTEPQWIPVSERLPETEGYGHYFLCCLENGVIRILGYSKTLTTRCPKGFYYEENGFTWRQDQNPAVAWMELPKPYERKEE